MPEPHFHDLQHTGNTMAAAEGASLRKLVERMAHSRPRATLIYLHATRERDKEVSKEGMGKTFMKAKKGTGARRGRYGFRPRRNRSPSSRRQALLQALAAWLLP